MDVNKTNPANYPLNTPIPGDRYIAVDTSFQYILSANPYTNNTKWILLSPGGVDSINTKTGIVLLDTSDIPEGTNKYFNSGITAYKATDANLPN